MKTQPIVQYIVLRRDLNWPAGAMAAQAAHASVAAISQAMDSNHAPAKAYIGPENLPHMTKYVYGVDSLEGLEQVRDKWMSSIPFEEGVQPAEGVQGPHYWWVEQPESIPAAFATWPIERTNKVSKLIKKLNLSFF